MLTLRPVPALAAANDKYPEDAFKQKSDADAIKALYGKTAEASDKVKLDAPEIAENGAVVPIAVTTTLADVTSISFCRQREPERAGGILCDSRRHCARRRQPAEDGEDLQRDRDRGSPAASSTAPPRKSKSPSAAAAAEHHEGANTDGIDHSRARHRQRRHHRGAGADPASDGYRPCEGRTRAADPGAFHPAAHFRA